MSILHYECIVKSVIIYSVLFCPVPAVHARDLVHRAHRARVRRREGAVAHRDRGSRRTAALGGAAGGPDALLRERILPARKVTAEDRLFSYGFPHVW